MSAAMNCDLVFDILTRGPFPSGDSTDEPVEKHLACCHECRQLAEALRPAVELLHESISAEEGAELPGYRGALRGLAPAARPVAVDERAGLVSLAPRRGQASPVQSWTSGVLWMRVAATLLLGVGAGILVHACLQWGGDDPAPPASGAPLAARASSLPTAEGEQLLARLDLPNACLMPGGRAAGEAPAEPVISSADLSRFSTAAGFICCKQCHAGEHLAERASAVRNIVSQQCLVCHR